MKANWKRWISFFLVTMLVVQMLPAAAFATDGGEIAILDDSGLWDEPEETDGEITIVDGGEPEDGIRLVDEATPKEEEARTYSAEDVLWENEALREAGTKHFHLSDGTEVAVVYQQPVHYLDGEGVYQDIDNSLELVERETRIEPVMRIGAVAAVTVQEAPEEEAAEDGVILIEEDEDGAPEIAIEPELPDGAVDIELIEEEPAAEDAQTSADDSSEETETPEPGRGAEPEKEYRNRAGLVDVRLAERSDADGLVSLSDGLYTLRFTPAWDAAGSDAVLLEQDLPYASDSFEAAIMPQSLTAGLRYEGVLPDVDLEYWVHPSGVKENIVLYALPEAADFPFVLDCGGLTPYPDEDGSVSLCDPEGAAVMRIPAGYMTDAEGAFSDAVSYELEDQGEGRWLLTVCADENWLGEESRAWPVSIDPSATATAYHDYSIESATIQNKNPNDPAGQTAVTKVGGEYETNAGSVTLYRTLVRVNNPPTLPANSVLVNASFHYYESQITKTGLSSLTIVARALSSNSAGSGNLWCIGKSWNTTPAAESNILDYATISSDVGFYDWDITRYAQKWYDDDSTNYGFVLMAYNESSMTSSSNAWAMFASSMNTGYGVYPYFTIQYRNTVGIEGYYTYQTHGIDRAGTGYVSDVSRQLTIVKTDAASASTVNPFALSHVYNSAYCTGEYRNQVFNSGSRYYYMDIGYGWKLSAQQTCSYYTNGYLSYCDADGTIHFLERIGDVYSGTFQDEDGLGLTAVASGGDGNLGINTNYTMTDLNGNIKYFAGGTLQYEQDANGNRITYQFDNSGRITGVVRKNSGGSNETLATLSYNGNKLSSITDSAGNVTSFTYNGNYLSTVTQPDGKTVSYTYSSGRLLSAKDNESGYSVNYEWTNGKLSRYYEKCDSTVGVSVTVDGTRGITSYRSNGLDRTANNSDDLISTRVFDYYGRTITSYTTNAAGTLIYGASGGKYKVNAGTDRDNNRLLTGTEVGMRPVGNTGGYTFTSPNLMQNPTMLSSGGGWSGGSYVSNAPGFGTAIKLTGTFSGNASSSQTVSISNGTAGQTYILSAWAKGDSAALKTGRSFALEAVLTYTDATTETQSASFCPDSTEWQYAVLPIVPKKNLPLTSIQVRFSYNKNVNSALFTHVCLTAESAAGYTWDANGNLTSVSTPQNATQTFSYSGADLIQQVTKGSGTFTYSYDSHHNVTGVTNAGLSMSLGYDTSGNATSSTLTGGSLQMSSSAAYTNNANLIASQTDTRGKTTSYAYANAISKQTGQPSSVTDANNVTVTNVQNAQNGRVYRSFVYNRVMLENTYGSGRVTAMTRTAAGATQTYNMGYNGFGQLTSVKVGTRSLASYTYAANDGLLTKLTYGNGNTIGYAYDNLERVTNVYYNNSSSAALTYTYKGEGTLGQLTDSINNRTYSYTYDSLGRLTGLTEKYGSNNAQTYSATYDTANRPTNVTYKVSPAWNGTLGSNRVYTYGYSSSDGSLTSMTGPGASMAYTYDALKRLTKRVVSSGSSEVITRNYSYLAGSGSNTSTLVSGLTAKHGSTTLFSGGYSYDNVGNITAITGSSPASYTYDDLNQLLTETRGGTTYTYTYNAAGNMLSKTKITGSGTDTFTYGNSEWRDLLTAYNGNSITYDTVGNPTTWYDGATMTWVNGKRLASISATSGHSALAFTYDADGLRLTKTVGSVQHKYIWQGDKLVSENYGNTTLEFFYDESGAPYALIYNGTTYYYVTNLQGDVVKIVNASGTSQAEYSYNAWGQVISATGTLAAVNPIRYRGYYYDSETGFYYLQSRYYDPNICRFINADGLASTGQGFIGCNMFAYCNNNPVNGYDPSGMLRNTCVMESDGGEGISNIVVATSFSELTVIYGKSFVLIRAYIVFEGDLCANTLIKGIEDYWEGEYSFPTGTKKVKVDIHCQKTSDGRAIYVNSIDGEGRGNTYPAFRDGGISRVTIYSRYDNGNDQNIGWVMAHEFGHCLGIEDYYTHSQESWYLRSFVSIMHHTNDHAQLSDIILAIQASETGEWQLWN